MFVDTPENAKRWESLHPRLGVAFAFLKRSDLAHLPDGRHEIDGARVFALVAHDKGRGRAGARLEAHRKYIDIQYVVSGNEVMGVKPTSKCRKVSAAYDETKDIGFFSDKPSEWILPAPGQFVVFYPEDAHAPLAGEGDVHKVVVKVAVDAL